MKTRHCENCQKADYSRSGHPCTAGHRPRFYLPIGTYPYYENEWGWKRRCADFAAGDPQGITTIQFPPIETTANLFRGPKIMPPTPRTDAVTRTHYDDGRRHSPYRYVFAEEMAKLERENVRLREALETIQCNDPETNRQHADEIANRL